MNFTFFERLRIRFHVRRSLGLTNVRSFHTLDERESAIKTVKNADFVKKLAKAKATLELGVDGHVDEKEFKKRVEEIREEIALFFLGFKK